MTACGADLFAQQPNEWSVAVRSVVEIGVADGDPDYMFTSIRGASLLPAGRIVVADRGTSSVRIFDASGNFEVSMGRDGEGPGEFQGIGGLSVHLPDTIRVWDFATIRITNFLFDGSLVGTQRFDSHQPGGPGGLLDGLAGFFSDGDVALSWTIAPRVSDGEVLPDETIFGRFSSEGSLKHLLGKGQGLHRVSRSPDPFSPYPHAVVYRDSVYFMNGVDGRVAIFGSSGEGVARTVEVTAPQVESSLAWAALRHKILETGRESLLERMPAPRLSHTPALAGMLVDDRGLIWVKEYDPTSDSVYFGPPPGPGGTWLVVTPEGESVATVAMPDGIIPVQVVGDLLLAVSRDELDVERIVIHTIAR
ncbi:MAG: 6-bladed beta-propeller [Rhodothermales bacterium]